MVKFSRLPLLALCLAAVSGSGPASAEALDEAFFRGVAGVWQGPGEIVAGKYKGTKFNCQLTGTAAPAGQAGVALDGTCRVGVFTQEMSARITREGAGYSGRFLDGAAGDGLDIVSGRIDGDRVIVGINRHQLNGAMVAHLTDPNTMTITVSVSVGETMVPVIGMTMARDIDAVSVGSIR